VGNVSEGLLLCMCNVYLWYLWTTRRRAGRLMLDICVRGPIVSFPQQKTAVQSIKPPCYPLNWEVQRTTCFYFVFSSLSVYLSYFFAAFSTFLSITFFSVKGNQSSLCSECFPKDFVVSAAVLLQ